MGITSFPGIPSLTPLERVGPKGYLRYVFPLRLQKDYSIEQISEILKTGFAAAKDRLPILACEAVPDLDSKRELYKEHCFPHIILLPAWRAIKMPENESLRCLCY